MKLELNETNEFMLEWILRQSDDNADHLLTEMIKHEMDKKLKLKRSQGIRGWYGPNISNFTLLEMLKKCLEKGDMIDVINLAAMIHARKKLFGASA